MSAGKISAAWAALNATPKYPRSWSAWTNALGHPTAMNAEQETNLRNAIAGKKPILGFQVQMSADEEKIKAAYYGRLLPLTIIEQTPGRIVGKAAEPIVGS